MARAAIGISGSPQEWQKVDPGTRTVPHLVHVDILEFQPI